MEPLLPENELLELQKYLTPRELADLDRLTLVRPRWEPASHPQAEAYDTPADELLYGGEPGGGKTALLVGLVCTQARKSIIFRREYGQLSEIIDNLSETLGNSARYNGSTHVFRCFDHRKIELGGLEREENVNKWKGIAHDGLFFDEITEFTEHMFRFLKTWNRTTVKGQRARIVCTSNPPTNEEGQWVKQYWAPWLDELYPHPAKNGELRWFARVKDLELRDGVWHARVTDEDKEVPNGNPIFVEGERYPIKPRSRTFIRARLDDNPFLRETEYRSQLQSLPEPLRSIMLHGDWSANPKDSAWQVCPRSWILEAAARWKEGDGGELTGMGVDVARGGSDNTTICMVHGKWVAPLIVTPGRETPTGESVAALVMQYWKPGVPIGIDVIGVGSSVYDALCARGTDVGNAAWPINFASASNQSNRNGMIKFVNKRAECYWGMREAIDPEGDVKIALPIDPELHSDMAATLWEPRVNGVKMEDKESVKRRIGRSPDRADALALALNVSPWFGWTPSC